jgi:uncharacterized protein YjbI with pentapeptide repeats
MKPKQSVKPKKKTFTDEQIRDKAYQIWKKHPERSSEDNLNAAINALSTEYRLRYLSNAWRLAGNIWGWTGIPDKKGFDFLQFLITVSIPIAIFLGTQYYSKQNNLQQQQIAENKQKDEVLKNYFDGMKSLLLDKEHPLRKSKREDESRSIARTLTLTALNQLSNDLNIQEVEVNKNSRKGLIVQFLQESNLIQRSKKKDPISNPIVGLKGANLKGANLNGANLSGAYLVGTDLNGADLSYANLSYAFVSEADLKGANLSYANLKGAILFNVNLSDADFREADLRNADLRNADLRNADLGGADLSGAEFHTADLRNSQGLTDTEKAALKKLGAIFDANP